MLDTVILLQFPAEYVRGGSAESVVSLNFSIFFAGAGAAAGCREELLQT